MIQEHQIQEKQMQEQYGLTEQQVEHFRVFGFLIRRKLFSPVEMRQIHDEFDRRLAAVQREAGPRDAHHFHNWPNRDPKSPYIASLLEDPRIYASSEQLLGQNAVPVHSNSNSYCEDTPWHPDTTDRHLLMIKNVMYLQRTTPDQGALRLIPGSHQSPLYDELLRIGIKGTCGDAPRFFTESGFSAEDIPCHVFSSEPGDLITFNERTWHGAFGSYADRRTCTFNFFSDPQSAAEKTDLRAQVASYKESRTALGTTGGQYDPWWLSNPDNSARRARWIRSLDEWGFVDAGNG